jgi:hypothetical protein
MQGDGDCTEQVWQAGQQGAVASYEGGDR